ncbi:MAG: electron transfer flavoprotein subunit beta/FixA family protein [Bacillota bacterium]|nr:electron transfer flavoprotein subunit beta/FixA family protein [Bacillota bacterium]
MKIVVCVKHVPDTTEISLCGDTRRVVRLGVTSGINLLDKNAVEAGLQLKEQYGGECNILSAGVSEADFTIKEALAMGADEGILVSDDRIIGSDSLATAKVLAAALKKQGEVDLILLGRMSTDGNTGQLASQLAECLDIDQVTFVQKIKEVTDGYLVADKLIDGGYQTVKVKLPAVVSVEKSVNEPRYPSIKGTMKANRKKIPVLTLDEIEVSPEEVGVGGSKLVMESYFEPPKREKGEVLTGEPEEVVNTLITQLKANKAI